MSEEMKVAIFNAIWKSSQEMRDRVFEKHMKTLSTNRGDEGFEKAEEDLRDAHSDLDEWVIFLNRAAQKIVELVEKNGNGGAR